MPLYFYYGKAIGREKSEDLPLLFLLEFPGKGIQTNINFNLDSLLYKCFAGLFLLSGIKTLAQDTVSLKEIDITAEKSRFSAYGKKIQEFDSAQKQQFIFNSVGELISLSSPVFVKNYGPGSLASTAFRGGSASHTGITWNGFNMQNVMLGQTDLSLLPSVLFSDISIEYGGSSALWGSGAVAGSIHLKNQAIFNRGLTTRANAGGGSFGLFNSSAAIEQSKENFFSSTKLYIQNSSNTFLYRDTLDKENPLKEQRHAAYSFRGLMQDLSFLKGPKHVFSFSAWYNEGLREIPVFNSFSVSKPEQKDINLKGTADWKYIKPNIKNALRAAAFYDELHYIDPGFATQSSAFLNTIILENETFYTLAKKHVLNVGANHTYNSAFTKNYSGMKVLQKSALNTGAKFEFFNSRLIAATSLRAEYFSAGNLPLTGNAAIEYKPLKSLSLKLNGAKVYRQPTLNELYWSPGGNENLLPEQGYTTESDVSWNFTKNNLRFGIGVSAYYRNIDNWILWLPANNMSTPVNVQKVFSRGTETQTHLTYKKNKWYCSMKLISAYVLSTVTESDQENGNTSGRQLIYTPRYSFNSNLTLAYSGTSVSVYHQYVGYRFTTSDNLQWLLPYYLFNARISHKTKINSTDLILFAACNNINNVNYAIVAGRPMPLRNFEFGISLSHNKTKQSETSH